MHGIKKVGLVSIAKIMAVVYAFFGLMTGAYISIGRLFGVEASGEMAQLQSAGPLMIVILPLIYAVLGALSGLASAFFFNLAVKWVGPLEVTIIQQQETAEPAGQ